MALPNDQLFLERFLAFNRRRYAEDEFILGQLDKLTVENTQFNNFRIVEHTPGVYTHVVDVVSDRILTGPDQEYLPADYALNGTAILQDPLPLSMEEIREKPNQGIYLVNGSPGEVKGVVLVWHGRKTEENIKALIRQNCYFELAEAEVITSQDLNMVDVNSKFIDGILFVVEGLYDNLPRYNGQYRANGSIRAL